MRSLERNKKQIYYASYAGKEELVDEYGNLSGEYEVVYHEPVPFKINVSPAKGEASTRQFGDTEDYDRVMVTSDLDCPIDENSILWIDNLDTSAPHDYIVKRVAKSLNSISYAVKKVNVSG